MSSSFIQITVESHIKTILDKAISHLQKTISTVVTTRTISYNAKTHSKCFTFIRSPHIDKKSKEQIALPFYKTTLNIFQTQQNFNKISATILELTKLMPNLIKIKIKIRYHT